jgi:ATP-dependent Lhr-like helicase
LPAQLEQALSDLVGLGLASCDTFAGLRVLLARRRRSGPPVASGRWTSFRAGAGTSASTGASTGAIAGTPAGTAGVAAGAAAGSADFAARRLLARTGVVFRRTIEREKLPLPWRELLRAMRAMEARGEVRGGRFVAGFTGEQYALPEAVEALRAVRRAHRAAAGAGAAEADDAGTGARSLGPARPPVLVVASDPLNFAGILTPEARVAATARATVRVA